MLYWLTHFPPGDCLPSSKNIRPKQRVLRLYMSNQLPEVEQRCACLKRSIPICHHRNDESRWRQCYSFTHHSARKRSAKPSAKTFPNALPQGHCGRFKECDVSQPHISGSRMVRSWLIASPILPPKHRAQRVMSSFLLGKEVMRKSRITAAARHSQRARG